MNYSASRDVRLERSAAEPVRAPPAPPGVDSADRLGCLPLMSVPPVLALRQLGEVLPRSVRDCVK